MKLLFSTPRRILSLSTILIAMLIQGCSFPELDFQSCPQVKVTEYKAGRPLIIRKINIRDALDRGLSEWIQNNKRGWWPTPATYAPGLLVECEAYSLNVLPSVVVISFQRKDGEYEQFYKAISAADNQTLWSAFSSSKQVGDFSANPLIPAMNSLTHVVLQ